MIISQVKCKFICFTISRGISLLQKKNVTFNYITSKDISNYSP